MVIIRVEVGVKPEASDQFQTAIAAVALSARALDGCRVYAWYPDPDRSGRYLVYGEFDSRQAFELYRASDAVRRIGTDLRPLLDGPPAFWHYDAEAFESG